MLGAARTRWLLLLSAALLTSPAAGFGESPPERWRSPAAWQGLRVGMSQSDVLRILGEPGRVTRYYAFTRWEYPDALGKRVNFDERGRLVAWGARAR